MVPNRTSIGVDGGAVGAGVPPGREKIGEGLI